MFRMYTKTGVPLVLLTGTQVERGRKCFLVRLDLNAAARTAIRCAFLWVAGKVQPKACILDGLAPDGLRGGLSNNVVFPKSSGRGDIPGQQQQQSGA